MEVSSFLPPCGSWNSGHQAWERLTHIHPQPTLKKALFTYIKEQITFMMKSGPEFIKFIPTFLSPSYT